MARALSLLFLAACHGAASEPPARSDSPRLSAQVANAARPAWGAASLSPSAPGAIPAAQPPPEHPLRNPALRSPLPGGTLAGYRGDTGLDIAADRKPVFAVAPGTLDYSERGHTLWTSGKDTPNSVRLALETPIAWKGHKITHVYYTHMSALTHQMHEGTEPRVVIKAGDALGVSGVGNGMPHLHIGFLLDGKVEQDSWDGILTEADVRVLFGGYRNGEKLP